MHNIGLPYGLATIKSGSSVFYPEDDLETRKMKIEQRKRKGSKEGLIFDLDLVGKKVLDVACGEGKYSFIAGEAARSVLGIDLDETRIEKARYLNSILDYNNVEFSVMDIYSQEFSELASFEISFCFGLLHRIPDPFNFINVLCGKSESILFEWKTVPKGKLGHDEPWAYHRPGGLYEWCNAVSNFEEKEIASQGRAGGGVNRSSYWYMSFRAVEAMCERAGMEHFRRFSRAPYYPDFSRDSNRSTERVMLLASRVQKANVFRT